MHSHAFQRAIAGLTESSGAGEDDFWRWRDRMYSAANRITPQQLGQVLQAGLRSPWAPEFQASLPIGATDGTMRRRLQNSPAAGRARLKTGSLRNVIALAGYVPDASGTPCAFVAFVNSERAGEGRGRAVLDALVDWVARSGSAGALTPAVVALPVVQ